MIKRATSSFALDLFPSLFDCCLIVLGLMRDDMSLHSICLHSNHIAPGLDCDEFSQSPLCPPLIRDRALAQALTPSRTSWSQHFSSCFFFFRLMIQADSELKSISPLATTLIPSRAGTLKYVRKLSDLVSLMLDVVDRYPMY
jgi:hypothetical protein